MSLAVNSSNNASSLWQSVSLRELGTLHCGQSPSSKDVNTIGIGTIYITGPEQWDGNKVRINKWTTSPKRIVPDGCVFITVKGSGVGKIFPGVAGAIGRDIYAFQPSEEHSAKFIEYALRFSVLDILRNAVGDIPGISKSHILDHEVFVPPLDQQKRIVAEIEKHFSRLDEAVANLKRVKANLKRYIAAVLKAAVEGKLTEEWRRTHPDVEQASELLKRILAERRAKWEESELAKMKTKGKLPKDNRWKNKYKGLPEVNTYGLAQLPGSWKWTTWEAVLANEDGSFKRGPFGRRSKEIHIR